MRKTLITFKEHNFGNEKPYTQECQCAFTLLLGKNVLALFTLGQGW